MFVLFPDCSYCFRIARTVFGLLVLIPFLPMCHLILFLVLTSWISGTRSVEVLVLHTNDVHARFEETDIYGGSCEEQTGCYGGAARRKTLVQKVK